MPIPKSLAVALLLLAASTAHAGTITVTVVTAGSPCNAGACNKTFTDTDANLAKIVVAYQQGCNTSINGNCTALQVIKYWIDQVVAKTVQDVQADQVQKQLNALAPPTPINPQ